MLSSLTYDSQIDTPDSHMRSTILLRNIPMQYTNLDSLISNYCHIIYFPYYTIQLTSSHRTGETI